MGKIISVITSLAVVLFFGSSTVFAGGGLVSFTVSSSNDDYNNYRLAYVQPGTQFVVRPLVYADNSYSAFCQNCPIKIRLENPQENDYIAQSSNTTDSSGTMYAKVISNVSGIRYVYAEVTMPDGSLYISSKYTLNYASSNSATLNSATTATSKSPTPTQPVSNTTQVQIPAANNAPAIIYVSTQPQNDELVKKVDSLQKQLDETNRRQTVVESKLSQILDWIKSIFAFYR